MGVTKEIGNTLGPGLITGASDDDPSGIATYSQVGAQFGFALLWTLLFSYPLMTIVQEISARIGRVTGRGLAGNVRRYYPAWLLYVLVGAMSIANVLNLGADIAAMGEACQLVLGGQMFWYSAALTVFSLGVEIIVPYSRYVFFLKWLTLSLLAYAGTVCIVHVSWTDVLRGTVIPTFVFHKAHWVALLAILGTTISPYLFFWQASEEAQEIKSHAQEKPLKQTPDQARQQLRRINIDTLIGMGFSNLIAFFIMVTAALTLHAQGIVSIDTAAKAAQALGPVAGHYAEILFAAGIVGTGLLAIPVLAGSTAYAWSETFAWRASLELSPRRAKRFYGIIALATVLGFALTLLHISPMKALYAAAVINGFVAVPILAAMMHLASDPRVMGTFTLSWGWRWGGWLTTAVMAAAALGLALTWF